MIRARRCVTRHLVSPSKDAATMLRRSEGVIRNQHQNIRGTRHG